MHLGLDIDGGQNSILGKHGRARDDIFQLANVTRPRVIFEFFDRGIVELSFLDRKFGGRLRQKMFGKLRNIFESIAERRYWQGYNGQPEKQVIAKTSLLHLFLQVTIGRGDHSDIDRTNFGRSDSFDGSLLKDAQ